MYPFRYITYDEDGNLTGCYFQLMQPEHEDRYIAVDESYVWTWTNYRANAARDGLELVPTSPEDPPAP